jgi:hypothetical protein
LAIKYNIDVTLPNWKELSQDAALQEYEEIVQREKEFKQQQIEKLHNRARSYGVNPTGHNEDEIHRLIAEEIDYRKKEELKQLRQRAMELQAGDPNLIKYGYSAEKLKQLIKEKEEKQ